MGIPALEQYIELLKATDQQLQKLLPQEGDCLLASSRYSIFDKTCRYLYASPNEARMRGSTPEQLIGKHCLDIGFPAAIMSEMEETVRKVIETKEIQQIDSKDNEDRYWHQIFFPLCKSDEVVAIAQLTVDITIQRTAEDDLQTSMGKQHQTEEILRRAESKFDEAFYANLNPMMITASSNGQYLDVNAAFANLVGYSREELLDEIVRPDVWQDDKQRHKAEVDVNSTHGVKNFGMTATAKSGDRKDVVVSSTFINHGAIGSIMTSMTDVTEKKVLQTGIARLDRLNLLGEMAASLSHEIRNPLTTVRGFLQLIGQKDTRYQEQFKLMIGELDRANGIITEFLSLAKNCQVELSKQSLNLIIDSIWPLMEADALSQGKSIVAELSEGMPFCLLDGRKIRQLILNLVRNGLEAIAPGKKVYVRTCTENNTVSLSIRDEGQGIPENIYANLGMPFNTTKENGTGLGLSVCYRIVEGHGATMDVHTGPDGTEFVIRFNPCLR